MDFFWRRLRASNLQQDGHGTQQTRRLVVPDGADSVEPVEVEEAVRRTPTSLRRTWIGAASALVAVAACMILYNRSRRQIAVPLRSSQAHEFGVKDEYVDDEEWNLGDSSDEDDDAEDHEATDQDKSLCGDVQDNTDYWAKNLYSIPGITSAKECCGRCREDGNCRAWTWGKVRGVPGLSDVCYLKEMAPGEAAASHRNENTTSGLPFMKGKDAAISLSCMTLIQSSGFERKLVKAQLEQETGIFTCDEYAVYSSRRIKLKHGVVTTRIDSDLQCQLADNSSAPLNTRIFLAFWTKVIADGRFRFHPWTVKVDADAVFLPERLFLSTNGPGSALKDPETGVYFSNCAEGLRGSIEVLSRIAVQVYGLGIMRCARGDAKLDFSTWGEDTFLDHCMSNVLNVKRVNDSNLVSDFLCPGASSGGGDCTTGAVAFHPFKTVDTYMRCVNVAQSA